MVLVVSFGSEVLPQLLHLLLCITNTAADAASDGAVQTDMPRADALGLAGEHIDLPPNVDCDKSIQQM